MEKEYCVYVHIFPNEKRYVGQTKQKPEYRFNNGEGYNGCPYMYRAIQKYGWENVRHEILIDGISAEQANYYEKYYIALYQSDCKKYGYNMRTGGHTGYIYTKEVRAKMSRIQTGRKQSAETRQKRSDALMRYYSANTVSDDVREKLRRPNSGQFKKGVPHDTSEETREKISKALKGRKGRPLTEEQKEHLRAIFKGRTMPHNSYVATEKYRFKEGHEVTQHTIDRLKEANSKAVIQYDANMIELARFPSITEASKAIGLSQNAVGNCVRGYVKTAGGYIWRYSYEQS